MDKCGAKILIVDDSEDDAYLLSSQISRIDRSAEFHRVDCGPDMRRALEEKEWDLVISDHSMPDFDSIRAFRTLRDSGRDAPFIIYSGHLEQDIGISAMQSGAHDFVYKNNPDRLLPVVRRELDHARLKREKLRAEQSHLQLANYDELSGLANSNLFREQLCQRMLGKGSSQATGALLYIDLDRFMRINDSFGYPAGDALIRQVASRLQACVGRADLVARMGQDEFVVFSSQATDVPSAAALAERIMQRFTPAFMLHGQEFFLTASIGVSLHPLHGSEPQTLLKNAESAMFAVKKLGRNQFQLYQHELNHSSGRRLMLENDLRHAVERNQLYLVYQPILDVESGRIVATEALLRWNHPEFGVVPPDQFIPLAEETGLLIDIGDWVLSRACAQTAAWRALGHADLCVAVNFSASQLNQPNFVQRLLALVESARLPPHALELEITESTAMHDAQACIDKLSVLKDAGVKIAIDDFGTGYSSLSYLKRFPIDILKIDKSFLVDVPGDGENTAIVNTISVLGKSLGLCLHAEGVETRAHHEFLRGLECNRVQGYYFHRPLAADDVLVALENCARRTDGTLPHEDLPAFAAAETPCPAMIPALAASCDRSGMALPIHALSDTLPAGTPA